MFGISTTLGVLIAFALRLNQVAIQITNYLMYPLQFLLLIPLVRLGETLLDRPPTPFHPSTMIEAFSSDFVGGVQVYGISLMVGTLAWLILAVPAVLVLQRSLLPPLRVWSSKA